MKNSFCDDNLEIVSQKDLQIPQLVTETLASIMMNYMDRLVTAADNTDWFKGTLPLFSAVERAGVLDDMITRDCTCPKCSSMMRGKVPLSVQLLSNAMVYLLKRRIITPQAITLPSIETLNKEVAERMTFANVITCEECEYEAISVIGPAN